MDDSVRRTGVVTSSRREGRAGPIVQYLGYVTLALRDQNGDQAGWGHYNLLHYYRQLGRYVLDN